ncbi:MAG: AEC family transporter, partial [Pseudomonadota bacterium]
GLPEWLGRSVALAGQLGIPLMLITLGVAVAQLSPGRIGHAVWLSLVKAVLSAGAAFAVAGLFALDPVARAVLVLQMLTPVAVTSYLLAETYRADSQAVAGLVVVSTALSVAILPLVLAVLASTGP